MQGSDGVTWMPRVYAIPENPRTFSTRRSILPLTPSLRTGKRETIAGYPCEHWLVGEGADQMDMCLAKGLGFFGFGGQGGRAGLGAAFPSLDRAGLEVLLAARPELKELVEGGAFPLKAETANLTLVVTRVERKALSDDLFRPPADCKQMDWQKMMPPMRKPPR